VEPPGAKKDGKNARFNRWRVVNDLNSLPDDALLFESRQFLDAVIVGVSIGVVV
jgi:hypothetical protein